MRLVLVHPSAGVSVLRSRLAAGGVGVECNPSLEALMSGEAATEKGKGAREGSA